MRVTALADSDSYLKWAAALLARMPEDWTKRIVVMRTPTLPSETQITAALAGSGIGRDRVEVHDFDAGITSAAADRADVVVVATVGPLADVVIRTLLDADPHRPVVVSGLPGIAVPARRIAMIYRSQADLIVLHSKREVRDFRHVARRNGFDERFGLSRLPFLPEGSAGQQDGDIVFAAQAIVPRRRRQREQVLDWLQELARRRPGTRVVVKVRAIGSENQTHPEDHNYADLLATRKSLPPNLVVEGGPMSERLRRASALVTVSSTAALEALGLGIPVLVLDDFGVNNRLINAVFEGSGVLGSSEDLMASRFRHPDPDWMRDNYFHDEAENDWLQRIERLVARNRAGRLPRRRRFERGRGGKLRRAWDRKRALGRYDRSALGVVALTVGTPARALVIAGRKALRRRYPTS